MLMISVILLWYDVFIRYSKYLLNICLGCCFLVLKWGRLFKYEKKCRDEYRVFKYDRMNYE